MTTPIRFNPEPCFRIFWEGRDPLAFSRSSIGNRFDPLPPPWEPTRVLYAGTSLETAVAETLLRWQGQITPGESLLLSESAQLQPRRVAHIVPKRTLTVIDATGLGLAPIEKAIKTTLEYPEYAATWSADSKPIAEDIFQCGADEHGLTQGWGAWFRSQCPDADGLTQVSRQFNVSRCVVLFEDRCGGQLELAEKPRSLYEPGSPVSGQTGHADHLTRNRHDSHKDRCMSQTNLSNAAGPECDGHSPPGSIRRYEVNRICAQARQALEVFC